MQDIDSGTIKAGRGSLRAELQGREEDEVW